MPADHRIYFQQQAPDILGNVQRGMQVADLINQRNLRNQQVQREQGVRDAYGAGMQVGPDGQVQFDRKATLSALAKADPMQAYQAQQQFQEQDRLRQQQELEDNMKKIDLTGRILGGVRDQSSYEKAIENAKRMGLDTAGMPRGYDPGFVENMRMRTMSAKDQLAAKMQQSELGLKERELGLKAAEMKQKASASNMPKPPSGYRYRADGSGFLEPIPGGPVAEAKQKQQSRRKESSKLVTEEIDRALEILQGSDMAAGPLAGGYTAWLPGTPADRLQKQLETVKAKIGFDELQAMREASPTGGALGAISERELSTLQAVAGNLDQAQDDKVLEDNLKRLWNKHMDVVHGPGQGPPRKKLSFQSELVTIQTPSGRTFEVPKSEAKEYLRYGATYKRTFKTDELDFVD